MDSFETAVQFLSQNLKSGDLLITMGAGDVWQIGESILQNIIKKMAL